MKHSKSELRSLDLPNGYKWSGFWDGMHHFTKRLDKGGYHYIKCEPKDIDDGNIYDMAEYEVTL